MQATTEAAWAHLQERLDAARSLSARGKLAPAIRAYRRLVQDLDGLDHRVLDPVVREAWLSLAVRSRLGWSACVLGATGDLDEAIAVLHRADALAAESEISALAALVAGQHGLLLLRSGRSRESVERFSRALSAHAFDAHRDLAVDHLNRGSAYVELGMFAAALDDFEAAHRHAKALGDPQFVFMALHNVGYATLQLGNLPHALAAMDEAREDAPEKHGAALLGRAEVLYEAGLWTDADPALEEAIPLLATAGLRLDRAEAEYYRARCLLGLGAYDQARRLAATAHRHFVAGGHAPRGVLARLLELEVDLIRAGSEGALRRAAADRRREDALSLVAAGDTAGPVLGIDPGNAARVVAARWCIRTDRLALARDVLTQVPRDSLGAPLTFRVQRYVAAAELAFAEGDRRRGLRAVRGGFSLLAEHRSRLGSVESVTAAAVHGAELQWIDVRAALATGRPSALFDALERGRTTGAGVGRVTPPEDPEAAALLTEARGLLAKARELPATGDKAAATEREALTRRARRMQAEVRERSWRHAGEAVGPERAVTAREVTRLLAQRGDGAVVVNFCVVDAHLRAVRVDGRGATTVDLGPTTDVAERVRRVRADLAITANDLIPAPLRAAAQGSLRRSLQALDDALVVPLRATGDLYVAARDPLITIPWSALPSRAGLRTAVRSYVARGRSQATPSGGRRVLTAAGPGVAQGEAEANAVGAVWLPAAEADQGVPADPGAQARQATVLTGAAATTDAVRKALATHDVVHLATHGRHDADNPLFASIELADGPLFAHELDGLRLPDSVVVLSSCEVGGHTAVLGGEVLGLTSVLLRLGARAVIASVAPLSDALAAEVMPRLHAHLRDTDDPEAALAAALADMSEPVPLVCFGSVEGLTA